MLSKLFYYSICANIYFCVITLSSLVVILWLVGNDNLEVFYFSDLHYSSSYPCTSAWHPLKAQLPISLNWFENGLPSEEVAFSVRPSSTSPYAPGTWLLYQQ